MSPRGRAEPAEDSVALSTWLRLLRAHGIIIREVRRSMAGQGTTLPRFDVLAQLHRTPDGLPPRELARRLLVSAGNLTVIVRQLEKEGLVRRVGVEGDRRSYLLVLTPAGRRRVARLVPRHRRDLQRLLSPVPARVLEELRELLGETIESLGDRGRGGRRPPRGDHREHESA